MKLNLITVDGVKYKVTGIDYGRVSPCGVFARVDMTLERLKRKPASRRRKKK